MVVSDGEPCGKGPPGAAGDLVPLSWAFGIRGVLFLLREPHTRGPVLPGRCWTLEGTGLRPWAGMLAGLRAVAANKQRKVVSKASKVLEQSRGHRSKQAATGSH